MADAVAGRLSLLGWRLHCAVMVAVGVCLRVLQWSSPSIALAVSAHMYGCTMSAMPRIRLVL